MRGMNSFGRIVVAAVLALGIGACRVQEPVAPSMEVPRDGAQVCAAHCGTMGLALGSVVLVANKMGCVCVPPAGPGPTAAVDGAGAVSALAFIADEEEEEAQRQQQQHASQAH